MDDKEYLWTAQQLAEEFISKPFDFVTETDLQVRLVEMLRAKLTEEGVLHSEVEDPRLNGHQRSYKETYKTDIEQKLKGQGNMDRVHTEVSVKQGKRYDVGVFKTELKHEIEWLRSGSKRYSERDLEAVFELKFIKNKCYFPTKCSIRSPKILKTKIDDLKKELDLGKNSIENDIQELEELQGEVEDIYTCMLIFSNNNYLFKDSISDAERGEKKKIRVGKAAIKWLEDNRGETTILYVHPKSYSILAD